MIYIRCYIGNGKIAKIKQTIEQTNYSNLTRLQINVDTILFFFFDSFFDKTHTVIGVTRAHA